MPYTVSKLPHPATMQHSYLDSYFAKFEVADRTARIREEAQATGPLAARFGYEEVYAAAVRALGPSCEEAKDCERWTMPKRQPL